MDFYSLDGICLCALGGRLPAGAKRAAAPFSPLAFLVERPGEISRGVYAIHDPAELREAEGPPLLLPPAPAHLDSPAAEAIVRGEGACVLNTAFSRAFDIWRHTMLHPKKQGLRLTLAGLGDVGGTVLTALTLLGNEIAEIGIYDPSDAMCRRYELELNQVLPLEDGRVMPRVVIRPPAHLFDCDVFLFTASRGVPPVGSGVADVRMAQFEANRAMLQSYARQAREGGFTGLFAQISDPVDHLARAVFTMSNTDDTGRLDFAGLLPEQVQGYGLGVMHARAAYFAQRDQIAFRNGAVFGPHGQELVVANDTTGKYDDALSRRLTDQTVRANLLVRNLGFKPYLAPGLSSAAVSILRTVRGQWHDGAVGFGGVWFGCRNRMTPLGLELLREPLAPALYDRICAAFRSLKEFDRA